MKIGNIEIGASNRPLVIPEIGINHEGNLQTAKEMALSARRAGARLIKHQTHIVEDEMSQAAKKVIPGNPDVSIYEIMKYDLKPRKTLVSYSKQAPSICFASSADSG